MVKKHNLAGLYIIKRSTQFSLFLALFSCTDLFAGKEVLCKYHLLEKPYGHHSSHRDLNAFEIELRSEGRKKLHILNIDPPMSKQVVDQGGNLYEIRDLGGFFKDSVTAKIHLAIATAAPDVSSIVFDFSPQIEALIINNGKEAKKVERMLYTGYSSYFGDWEQKDDMALFVAQSFGTYVPSFVWSSDYSLYYKKNMLVVTRKGSEGEPEYLATLSLFRPTLLEKTFLSLHELMLMNEDESISMYDRIPKVELKRLKKDIENLVQGELYGEFSRFKKFAPDLPQEIMASLTYEGLIIAQSGAMPLRYVFAAAGHPKLADMYENKFGFQRLGEYKDFSGILDSVWYLDLKSEKARALLQALSHGKAKDF